MKIDKIIEMLERVEKELNKRGITGRYYINGEHLVIETDKYDIKWSTTFKTNVLFFHNSLLHFLKDVIDKKHKNTMNKLRGNSNE